MKNLKRRLISWTNKLDEKGIDGSEWKDMKVLRTVLFDEILTLFQFSGKVNRRENKGGGNEVNGRTRFLQLSPYLQKIKYWVKRSGREGAKVKNQLK